MRYQYEVEDDEDDEVVDYKKWARTERLADWRIFAVLMVLIVALVGSGLPQWDGYSIVWKLFACKFGSLRFFVALLFFIIWGVAIFATIAGHGFRCIEISGICFMCYQIVPFLLRFVYVWLDEWLHSKNNPKCLCGNYSWV